MTTLIKNIGRLIQTENEIRPYVAGESMNVLPEIENAFLLIEDEVIKSFGKMENAPSTADEVIDVKGRYVLPSFCDGHTHIVYAGSREHEFIDKINGLSYEEIAKRGGGILNSAERLHNTSEDELYEQALMRVNEMIAFGTGAADIKSGYGLSVEDELKMLRVIKRLKETTPLTIRANFLGAHAVPAKYKNNQTAYVDLICNEMIPAVAAEGLAEFIDVFCDKGFFTVEETARMLEVGAKYGMRPIIGFNYGAGEIKRVKKTLHISLLFSSAIMLVGTFLSLFKTQEIFSMFNADSNMLSVGVPALQIISLGFLVSTFGVIYSGAFEALGQGLPSLVISLLRQFVTVILLSYTLPYFFGELGIWMSFPISEFIAAIVAIVLMRRCLAKHEHGIVE